MYYNTARPYEIYFKTLFLNHSRTISKLTAIVEQRPYTLRFKLFFEQTRYVVCDFLMSNLLKQYSSESLFNPFVTFLHKYIISVATITWND